MAAAPVGADKAAAGNGAVSVVLLDLGEIRRAREGEWDGTPAMGLRDPSALFKTCPRLLQKQHRLTSSGNNSGGGSSVGLVGSSLAAIHGSDDGAGAGERRRRERLLLCGAAAQRDLAAVARIFSRLVPRDPGDSALEEVSVSVMMVMGVRLRPQVGQVGREGQCRSALQDPGDSALKEVGRWGREQGAGQGRLTLQDPDDSALEEVGRWGRGHPNDTDALYLMMG